jgi:CRP/FNR family transcriptional regulator, cyclic AMP receptor protein
MIDTPRTALGREADVTWDVEVRSAPPSSTMSSAGRSVDRSALTFLERLDPVHQVRLFELGRVRRYPPQSILFFEGDDAHDVVVVRSGELKVARTVEGREVLLDVLGGGDVLGELSAIDGYPRSATATALTTVDVIAIPAATFRRFLAEHPSVALILMRCVTGRLRDASRRQVEYGALDGLGRVCRRLVEMMERYGEPVGASVLISAPLTQGDIAAWAGLSREAVVKALRGLRRLGWVTTTPRSITVVNVDAVTSRAALA